MSPATAALKYNTQQRARRAGGGAAAAQAADDEGRRLRAGAAMNSPLLPLPPRPLPTIQQIERADVDTERRRLVCRSWCAVLALSAARNNSTRSSCSTCPNWDSPARAVAHALWNRARLLAAASEQTTSLHLAFQQNCLIARCFAPPLAHAPCLPHNNAALNHSSTASTTAKPACRR